MRLKSHIAAGIPLGIISYYFSRSYTYTVIIILSSILIDIDHLIDYFREYPIKEFSIKHFFYVCDKSRFKKLYLFLHSYEIPGLLLIVYYFEKNFFLQAVALGFLYHMVLDNICNLKRVKGYLYYFFVYRCYIKFTFNEDF